MSETNNDNKIDMRGRKIEDVAEIHVTVAFPDANGYVVPLTPFQTAVLLKTFGFKINGETGELTHYNDMELAKEFGLEGD